MLPILFGPRDARLFGVFHGATTTPRSEGIVLCQPIGHEYIRAHRTFRQLAVHLAGAGTLDWPAGSPRVTPSTLYDLASLTKVVATTTAAMILEDEGRLDLARTVASYVPELSDSAKAGITVRMLLTHTSGIRSNLRLWKEA